MTTKDQDLDTYGMNLESADQEYRRYYDEIQDDGYVGKTDEPLPPSHDVVGLTPNYTITIATMSELCSWFRQYTGSWASLKDIQRSFEKRIKRGINDDWIKRWYEAVAMYGPASKTARVIQVHNKAPLVGRTEIAKAMIGLSSSIQASYIALGSGGNTPADGDVKLQTEFTRSALSAGDVLYDNHIAYFNKFFGSSQVGSRTILEAGIFIGGTITADSGILLSRVNINETTTANETMTINASITLTSAT